MVDTIRTLPELLTMMADNSTGDISPQDMRDFLVTIFGITDDLNGRVTNLESGFPSTTTAKWGIFHYRFPPQAGPAAATDYGVAALEAATGLPALLHHWYVQAGGWPGPNNVNGYNWADVQAQVAECLLNGVSPMIGWEFFGTQQANPVRRRLGAQDFPLLAFTTTPASGNGTGATSTNTTFTVSGATWTTDQWVGQIIKSNGKALLVSANTGTVITGIAWTGGSNPGNGQSWSIRPVGLTTQTIVSADGGGMTATATTLTQSGAGWTVNQFTGATVYANGKTMIVTSNTATVLTGASWAGGTPANGSEYNIGPVATITGSEWDTLQQYIDSWAQGAAAEIPTSGTSEIYFVIFHEMNLAYNSSIGYPWGVYDVWLDGLYKATGNTSARYVAAWRYVVDRFIAAGATNVKFVWNPGGDLGPNPITPGSYPGDTYVNYIGETTYNTSPAGVLPTDYATLAASSLGGTATSGAQRMIFSEVGVAASADGGTTPPLQWINTDLHNMIVAGAARIEFIVWWNQWNYAITSDNPDGSGCTTTNTTLTDSNAGFGTNEFVGATVTCNGKTATVTSNTGTVLTMSAGWSGSGNPGNAQAYKCVMDALCAAIEPALTV